MTMTNLTREEKVLTFRNAASKGTFMTDPSETVMITNCICEELDEFIEAAQIYERNPYDTAARANLCKEWADLQYVVSQAALFYEIPADKSFDRVHDSNMTKVVDGKIILRDDGKILKPDTYRAPDMRGL
jgi:predicted HAD superfamily Cof-like phosphohydrolase